MATNTKLMAERFNEVAACQELQARTSRLIELAHEPSTKRFSKDRPVAAAEWTEVRELAASRAVAASKPVTPVKRASKPRPTDLQSAIERQKAETNVAQSA